MKLSLISKDRDLYHKIQEILSDLPGPAWSILCGEFDGSDPEADLYIWDLSNSLELPIQFVQHNLRKHLFLLTRRNLPAFRNVIPSPDVLLLLKPITSASLRANLSQFVASQSRAGFHPSTEESLRSDRDQILQCLLQANLELQEYDQERTNFLARAVHDFRAPLTAISGYCGLLLADQLGHLTFHQREVLERMQHSTARLSRMANAMFQLSIGRKVNTMPNCQPCDMRDCIEQALHEVLPLTNDKNISISLDLTPPPEPLSFESSQLEQVFINLLDNALKFTPKGGSIAIRAYPYFWERRGLNDYLWRQGDRRVREKQYPNAYRVDIQDSGAGIPEKDLNSIFEEYTSYSGSWDRSGGGLGLAICKMIISHHHGSVWVENAKPPGAVFSFVLPMHRAEPRLLEPPVTSEYVMTTGAQ